MAENLCTGHELIIKAYDEVGGELLYSGGFITEPNDTVEDFLLENNITLSNAATAEVECALTGDLWTMSGTRKAQTFNQILSAISVVWWCTSGGDMIEGDATEIPATVEMRIYGAFKKENNQHGAIFTWHSIPYDDYSAMRGPCPEGFHVPSSNEWNTLRSILLNTFGLAKNDTTIGTYLKMPKAGGRYYTSSNIGGAGSFGYYWSANTTSANNAYRFSFGSSYIDVYILDRRAYGLPIRCFKDTPVIPTSSWTTLYDGSSVATGAGVFYNATGGLISVSGDGVTWYTIMDKNLGATSTDITSIDSYGYYYQWGNNYGFPTTGTVTTSSTQVDASTYGPGNYYNSNIFITINGDWSSVQNDNLRGGVTGVKSGYKLLHKEKYIDYSAMRGPCPEGFHIMTEGERNGVANMGVVLGARIRTNDTSQNHDNESENPFRYYLRIPRQDYIDYNGSTTLASQHSNVSYMAPHAFNASYGGSLGIISSRGNVRASGLSSGANRAYPIRPIKDEPVIPDNTWTMLYNGSNIATGAGIFRNESKGLTSISDDGITRYTIMDKDIGATEVYNKTDGSIQTGAIGKCFQRGNNYGFNPRASFTTSTTTVDATNYGPENYYYSDVFITTSIYNGTVYDPANSNLRGGTTGAVERERRVI